MQNTAEQQNDALHPAITGSILIIDDEASIRKSLEGALRDEGFAVSTASDGLTGLRMIESERPLLVLLDIWMPGVDGIETLRQIKERFPKVAVIMISGHAAIATAMSAIKLGASDFIEKPLDLSLTLAAIHRVFDAKESAIFSPKNEGQEPIQFPIGTSDRPYELRRIAFEQSLPLGKRFVQKTLARSAIMYGQGLHSGKKSGLIFEPLPPNSGIHMVAVSEHDPVPAHLEYVSSTGFATTIRSGRTQVGTIEHLMSALNAYGISNLMIKCNGEVPVFDGSSMEFCKLFEEVELEEQSGDWYAIRVPKTVRVDGKGGEFIQIEPADEFTIDYTLKYPLPLGDMRMQFTLNEV
jgi:CheY-like chemotaxis protein